MVYINLNDSNTKILMTNKIKYSGHDSSRKSQMIKLFYQNSVFIIMYTITIFNIVKFSGGV